MVSAPPKESAASKKRLVKLGTALCVVALTIGVIGTLGIRLRSVSPELLAEVHRAVRGPYRALSRYAEASGSTPSDVRGPEYALYKCKPFVGEGLYYWPERLPRDRWDPGDLSLFDLPRQWPNNGKPWWDDREQRLVGADFDYLNESRPLDRTRASFALYAERRRLGGKGRWVVFCNGAALWISRKNRHYAEPLGMSWAALSAGEVEGVVQPVGILSLDQIGTKLWHLDDLWSLLAMYAYDSGHAPYSPGGEEEALYLLKKRAPDPAIFDAAYTRLENGAAYYDDKSRKVLNCDFDCLNEPLSAEVMSATETGLVILADKEGVCGSRVRYAVSKGGYSGGVVANESRKEAGGLLGEEASSLHTIVGW
jgi:hypothetical protein